MSGPTIGFLFFAIMMVLLAVRVPVGAAMLLSGMGGYVALLGWSPLMGYLKGLVFAKLSIYELSVIPMFILMAQFASKGGLSASIFNAANALIGRFRGGVAMAGVGACAAFGAICGSSLATAATMGQVALPELRRLNYNPKLATGALAAGGTLGILIPPSIPLVIYAIMTQQNIAKLFAAALVPGLIATAGYFVVIALYARFVPGSAPAGQRSTLPQIIRALIDVWPVGLIFMAVFVGIYTGVFTPTEAAAVGALGAAAAAWMRGAMTRRSFLDAITKTAESTAMIYFIVIGGDMFSVFLASSTLPTVISEYVAHSGFQPLVILLIIILIYLFLGCIMDSMSMILLTIPIFFPVIMSLNFWDLDQTSKAIWFGILMLMVVEIGLITPPVGMNVYIISAISKDVPMLETFKGVIPFLLSDLVRVALLVFFPSVALFILKF